MATTSTRVAEKPAWLMMPLALASRSAGLEVRPRSNPIIDAGPPIPMTTMSTTSSQSGAGPGQASTAVQTTTIDQTMVSTVVERCHGCRPMSQPSTGPLYMTATTIRLSRGSAVVPPTAPRPGPGTGSPTAGSAPWR